MKWYSMARRLAASAVMLSAVLAVTGCGGIHTTAVGGDGPDFYVHGRHLLPPGGLDAQVGGTLAVANGCLLLSADTAGYPVVWPNGTTLASTDPLIVALSSGEQVAIGERVFGAGGYLPVDSLDVAIAEACLNEHREVAVFNVHDRPVKVTR